MAGLGPEELGWLGAELVDDALGRGNSSGAAAGDPLPHQLSLVSPASRCSLEEDAGISNI